MTATKTQEWPAPRYTPDIAEEDRKAWTELTGRMAAVAARYGWSKSEVARRSGIATGTLSQWYDGNYAGSFANVSIKVSRWLESVAEVAATAARIPRAPGYVATPTSRELSDMLLYAQTLGEMAVVTLGAGMGKTMTARHYVETRPHAFLVTMRPTTSSVHGMLVELSQALDVNERNPGRLDRALGEKLRRNGRETLLIVDEAQHLSDQAVNELRYFLDEYGCGIALLGNEELYGRFGGHKAVPAYAQIHRRIGKRLRRLQPLDDDVGALIAAWGIADETVTKLARALGRKPGALSQISKTLQLAGMYAAGEERAVTAADVKAAWADRGGEEL
ncbi:AAA family ATPase [Kaustia mangrovi]|uniref:AAA family ATPase n=1 Tax=Kaustia mangrovi TaxID=2593653 RepID=A0A7S8C726_9HYPH|nr:AAA family ATPase [Kaustia mangrovi]QPC44603.1 AAA family ATPase [Kaustia mangrovi]